MTVLPRVLSALLLVLLSLDLLAHAIVAAAVR